MLPQNYAMDVLRIQSSRDSGIFYNYQTEYLIGDIGALNTGGVKPSPYTPLEQEWVTISDVKLPRGTNRINFHIIRTNITGTGNMAYLDNVKIDTCYTPAPIGDAIQYDSTYTTLEDLVAVGNGLRWYNTEDSYDTLAHSTALSDSTYYYVTQTLNGCESAPLAIL